MCTICMFVTSESYMQLVILDFSIMSYYSIFHCADFSSGYSVTDIKKEIIY